MLLPNQTLFSLSNALNSFSTFPLAHFGNFVHLSGNAKGFLQRRNFQEFRFRNISWNLPYSQNSDDLLISDFKFDAPFLSPGSMKDIQTNIDFRHSLIEYAVRLGRINEKDYANFLKTAIEELRKWGCLDPKSKSYVILNPSRVPVYVANVGSVYSKFGLDSDAIKERIKSWVEGNIMTFGEKLEERGGFKELQGTSAINPELYFLLSQTDRTEEGFIGAICSLLSYSRKKAELIVRELRERGLIFEKNNKLYWTFESGLGLGE